MVGLLDWALHSSTDLLCLMCRWQFVVLGRAPTLWPVSFLLMRCPQFLLGKKVLVNFISSRDGPTKDKQGRDEITQEHYPILWNDGGFLSGLQHNALASLVNFVVCKVN